MTTATAPVATEAPVETPAVVAPPVVTPPPGVESPVAEFFSSASVGEVQAELEGLLTDISNAEGPEAEAEAAAALLAIRKGIADAQQAVEVSRLQREIAAEEAAVTAAVAAIAEKKKRLAELSPQAAPKKRGRRTAAEIEAANVITNARNAAAAEKAGE
jgi:hypothetical protein